MSSEQGNVQPWREHVERVRTYIYDVAPMRAPTRESAIAALDALTTQIEGMEKLVLRGQTREAEILRLEAQIEELDEIGAAAEGHAYESEFLRRRAEKAELALAEKDTSNES